MSSQYFKAPDYDYWFKSDPRELGIHDSLCWADNFGHSVEGQGGIVLRTLAAEVRRLNRIIYAGKVSDSAVSTSQRDTGEFSTEFDYKPPYLRGETD